jgi:peptidoglycan/LPS O-acetylase OafA/YrhL
MTQAEKIRDPLAFLPAIQALRGLAALLVVLFHARQMLIAHGESSGILEAFAGGDVGVDIFFIVSGFIMMHIQPRYAGDGAAGAGRFLFKRAERVIPPYWIYTLLVLGMFTVVPSLSQGGFPDVLKSFLLIPDDQPFLLMVGWTLSYEVLFYLTFALGLALVTSRKRLMVLILAIAAGLALAGVVLRPAGPELKVLTSPLLLEFAFGAALASAASVIRFRSNPAGLGLMALGIALYVAGQMWHVGEAGDLRVLTYGLPSAVFVTGAVLTRFAVNRPYRALILLGSASYSLYLSHWLVMNAIGVGWSKLGLSSDIALAALIVAACVAWAILTYRFVEQTVITTLLNLATRDRHRPPAQIALAGQAEPPAASAPVAAPAPDPTLT